MPLFPSPCSVLARQFLPVIAQCASAIHAHAVFDFGPAFLPEKKGLCRTSRNRLENQEKADLSVSCFSLSLLDRDAIASLLAAMHTASPYVLLADFKIAERNIEIPTCLLMSGMRCLSSTSAGCFNIYGGLEGLLYAKRARFLPMERYSLLGGSLSCVLVRCL